MINSRKRQVDWIRNFSESCIMGVRCCFVFACSFFFHHTVSSIINVKWALTCCSNAKTERIGFRMSGVFYLMSFRYVFLLRLRNAQWNSNLLRSFFLFWSILAAPKKHSTHSIISVENECGFLSFSSSSAKITPSRREKYQRTLKCCSKKTRKRICKSEKKSVRKHHFIALTM